MFVLGEHQILILARNCFQNKPPGIQPLLQSTSVFALCIYPARQNSWVRGFYPAAAAHARARAIRDQPQTQDI